jgi:hypothetical protein
VAGPLRHVAIGERRLHWLKNVTEPVAARLVEHAPQPEKSPFLNAFCSIKRGPMPLGGTA